MRPTDFCHPYQTESLLLHPRSRLSRPLSCAEAQGGVAKDRAFFHDASARRAEPLDRGGVFTRSRSESTAYASSVTSPSDSAAPPFQVGSSMRSWFGGSRSSSAWPREESHMETTHDAIPSECASSAFPPFGGGRGAPLRMSTTVSMRRNGLATLPPRNRDLNRPFATGRPNPTTTNRGCVSGSSCR